MAHCDYLLIDNCSLLIDNKNDDGNDLFGMELYYDNASTAQYNGNIGQINWNSATEALLQEYHYSYDGANRLTAADYKKCQ